MQTINGCMTTSKDVGKVKNVPPLFSSRSALVKSKSVLILFTVTLAAKCTHMHNEGIKVHTNSQMPVTVKLSVC